MNNVSFYKTPSEIAAMSCCDRPSNEWFLCQQKIEAYWLFDEAVYRKILPPFLKPVAPYAQAFVAYFGKPATELYAYREGALFIIGEYEGKTYGYCLAMPLDGYDMAIFTGREVYNYPKKKAVVGLKRTGSRAEGYIERHGIRFFEIKADVGKANSPDFAAFCPEPVLNDPRDEEVLLLDYKAKVEGIQSPAWQVFRFDDVRATAQRNTVITRSCEEMFVSELSFAESEDDPWAELRPTQILGARYMHFETRMLGTQTLRNFSAEEVETLKPYLFNKYDTIMFQNPHFDGMSK